MTLATEVKSMYNHTKEVYDSLETLGATMPENKNLENLVATLNNVPVIPTVPDAPDLSQVLDKSALDDIQAIVAAGKASEKFNLGDELLVSYSTYTMSFEIVGFEDVEVEGGETVPAINLLARYTGNDIVVYGANATVNYSASTLRNHIITLYQNRLDSNFVACLANTKIQTYGFQGSTDTVYDKLFAPSMQNLGVTNTVNNTAAQAAIEGPMFPEYIGADNNKRIKYDLANTSIAQMYWTRTRYLGTDGEFQSINAAGEPYYYANHYNTTYRVVAACNLVGKGDAE